MLRRKKTILGLLVLLYLLCFQFSGAVAFDDPCQNCPKIPENVTYPENWCHAAEITGSSTATVAGGIWEGPVSRAVSGMIVTIEWNGQDSPSSSVDLVANGTRVEVTLGQDACGTFRVVMTNNCGDIFYGPWVRIEDAGGWELLPGQSCEHDCPGVYHPPDNRCGMFPYSGRWCVQGPYCYNYSAYWACTPNAVDTTCRPPCTAYYNAPCYTDMQVRKWVCGGSPYPCSYWAGS